MGLRSKPRRLYSAVLFYRHASLASKAHITVRQRQEDQPGVRSFIGYPIKQTRELFIFLARIVCHINIEKDVVLLKMLSMHIRGTREGGGG